MNQVAQIDRPRLEAKRTINPAHRGLTRKQSDLLTFLERCERTPSFEEMKDHLGLASKSGVFRLIEALEERGRIRRLKNRARSIEIVKHTELSEISTDAMLFELIRRGFFKNSDGAMPPT